MDDLSAYHASSIHHTSYQPQPPGTAYPPSATVAQPIYVPPQFAGYAPPVYPQSPEDQVRTLFVAGLPEDVKPREIYHLFRECPGYQSSNLRLPTSSNNQPFAFATFVDQQSAIMDLHAINAESASDHYKYFGDYCRSFWGVHTMEMVFDLEKGSTLHIDLAKSNSRSKRVRGDDGSQGSEKRQKGSSPFSWNNDPGYSSVHTPGMANPAYITIAYPSTQSLQNVDSGSTKGFSTKSTGTPCPTLFVANLGPTCSDEELTQIFSRCRGFLKLKMQGTYGAPVAFVDFKDTACSIEALNHLQSTIIYSSTSGEGMRLEYAKSRMGMRSKKSR